MSSVQRLCPFLFLTMPGYQDSLNSLRPCYAIWRHRSGSTLAVARRHQAITWTSGKKSSVVFTRAISQGMLKASIAETSSKMADLKL